MIGFTMNSGKGGLIITALMKLHFMMKKAVSPYYSYKNDGFN